jgi:hypothetical protein
MNEEIRRSKVMLGSEHDSPLKFPTGASMDENRGRRLTNSDYRLAKQRDALVRRHLSAANRLHSICSRNDAAELKVAVSRRSDSAGNQRRPVVQLLVAEQHHIRIAQASAIVFDEAGDRNAFCVQQNDVDAGAFVAAPEFYRRSGGGGCNCWVKGRHEPSWGEWIPRLAKDGSHEIDTRPQAVHTVPPLVVGTGIFFGMTHLTQTASGTRSREEDDWHTHDGIAGRIEHSAFNDSRAV